jgi:pimeloyl-ACP methyl ester carboxylesterase
MNARVLGPTARPKQKAVAISANLSLPYLEQGTARGLPVVFLHGYTDSCRSFIPVLERLSPSLHAIAITQRGHGDASRPESGYHPRDLAGDLATFLDAIGIDAAVIVGHSMGSQVALRFAVEHPRRVRGLALLGGFATLSGNKLAEELWHAVAQLEDPVDPEFVREFQRGTLAHPVSDRFFEMIVGESRKLPARIWRAALAGQIEENVYGELGQLRGPTLIAWGDKDAILSRQQQDALAAAIAGSRLSVYAGGGHGFHWEDPVRFVGELTSFVSGLG